MRAKHRVAKSYIVLRFTVPQTRALASAVDWVIAYAPLWMTGRVKRRLFEVSTRVHDALFHHERRDVGQ